MHLLCVALLVSLLLLVSVVGIDACHSCHETLAIFHGKERKFWSSRSRSEISYGKLSYFVQRTLYSKRQNTVWVGRFTSLLEVEEESWSTYVVMLSLCRWTCRLSQDRYGGYLWVIWSACGHKTWTAKSKYWKFAQIVRSSCVHPLIPPEPLISVRRGWLSNYNYEYLIIFAK